MIESDQVKKERREKAVQLSIKMQRAAFSKLCRSLARIGHSVPQEMREDFEKHIESTPDFFAAFYRDIDAVNAKEGHEAGEFVKRSTNRKSMGGKAVIK